MSATEAMRMVAVARVLRPVDAGENPEYVRGQAELIAYWCGLSDDSIPNIITLIEVGS